jgi:putative membrane protein
MLIALVSNALGLLVADVVLDGFNLNATGFVVAVVVFTVAFALLQPFLLVQLRGSRAGVLGGVALIATLASLIITTLITDGLSIDGVTAWVAGTLIVWLVSVLAGFILPALGLKKYLEEKNA